MPTMPTSLTGAPMTDATAVPWKSSRLSTTLCVFSPVVSGRAANSGWEKSRPVSITSTGTPGPGVPVDVIDTGLDFSHPEFAARPDTTGLNTQSVVDSREDFHGTAVASVIGAPVNDVGMVGIYPQAVLG